MSCVQIVLPCRHNLEICFAVVHLFDLAYCIPSIHPQNAVVTGCYFQRYVGELCLTNATGWKALDSMVSDVFMVSGLHINLPVQCSFCFCIFPLYVDFCCVM